MTSFFEPSSIFKNKEEEQLFKSANNAEDLDDNNLEDTYIYLSLYKTSKFKMFKIWYKRASEFEGCAIKKTYWRKFKLLTPKYRKLSLYVR